MSYANCLEGYLTSGCETCPEWSDGSEPGRGIGCAAYFPIIYTLDGKPLFCVEYTLDYFHDGKIYRLDTHVGVRFV